jgi:soluble lytic murein transglycosylase-like protein
LVLVAVIVAILFLLFTPSTIAVKVEVEEAPIEKPYLAPKTVVEVIVETARLHAIDEKKFLAVAKCESSLNPSAVGDGGKSYGLFQIHLPSHPDVSKEDALNQVWASEWAAKKFKKNPRIWTCFNKLYE